MCENFAEREYKKKFLEAFRRKYGKNAKFSMGYMCIFAVTPLAGVGIEITYPGVSNWNGGRSPPSRGWELKWR